MNLMSKVFPNKKLSGASGNTFGPNLCFLPITELKRSIQYYLSEKKNVFHNLITFCACLLYNFWKIHIYTHLSVDDINNSK